MNDNESFLQSVLKKKKLKTGWKDYQSCYQSSFPVTFQSIQRFLKYSFYGKISTKTSF